MVPKVTVKDMEGVGKFSGPLKPQLQKPLQTPWKKFIPEDKD